MENYMVKYIPSTIAMVARASISGLLSSLSQCVSSRLRCSTCPGGGASRGQFQDWVVSVAPAECPPTAGRNVGARPLSEVEAAYRNSAGDGGGDLDSRKRLLAMRSTRLRANRTAAAVASGAAGASGVAAAAAATDVAAAATLARKRRRLGLLKGFEAAGTVDPTACVRRKFKLMSLACT